MNDPQNLSFYHEWKGLINILIGAFFTGIASFVLYFFSNKYNWRNKLFKEFTVYIKIDTKEKRGGKESKIQLYYELNNGSDKSHFISYAFFILPKKYKGRYNPQHTLGEALFGTERDYEESLKGKIVEHSLIGTLEIVHEGIMKAVNDGKMKQLQLVVNTPRYGLVYSNKVRIWD